LNIALPAQPLFGEPLPIGEGRREVLDFLARRRSTSAGTLRAPAPDGAELAELLRLAARVPDHGKLFPWRFVILEGEAKAEFTAALEVIATRQPNPEKARGALFKIKVPPLTVAVVSRHIEATIPEREQRLSAAAVCMTLLIAAEAAGYGANWITDWYAYAPEATALLGLGVGEQVAGYIHIGTPAEAPLERVRPDVPALTMLWKAPA
jgi:nitroreductase